MARRYFIAGNWKMNNTASKAVELINGINAQIAGETSVDVAVCPTFTALDASSKALAGSNVKLGAQNMYTKASGAYTGEISAEMLKEFNCTYVILGHSERREYFKETDAFINEKVKAVLANGMKPILCVGEKLEEREAEIDELMTREDIYTNSVKCQELSNEKAKNAEELEMLYEKWEELAE